MKINVKALLAGAETFARAAVAQYGGHWAIRETLAAS